MSHLKMWITLSLLLLIVSACAPAQAGNDSNNLSERTINVVATTGMVADAARKVGGERVSVIGLMGPGIDPHLYKASAGDVSTLERADVIFYNGLHLEAGMGGVLERMSGSIRTFAVTDDIERERLLAPAEFEGAYDPHIWFDVSMWMSAVESVRDAYLELDTANAAIYNRNAEAYLSELQDLHAYVQQQASRIPEDRRVLITAHDAFNYFGRAYGFEVRGLQGISTETEASTAGVSALADFITARQIPAIFVESSVPQRNLEAVKAAVQNRGFDVRIGGELFSDALGNTGTPEGEYMGMVRHNIDTIVNALLEG